MTLYADINIINFLYLPYILFARKINQLCFKEDDSFFMKKEDRQFGCKLMNFFLDIW